MRERESPVRVVQQEFDVVVEEPYYWARLDKPFNNETLTEELNADAVRYAPDEFSGLIYQPPFSEPVFVFLRGRILVDLTSETAKKAKSRISGLLSTLAARGIFDRAATPEVKDVSREQLSTDAIKAIEEESEDELTVTLPDIPQSIVAQRLFEPRNRLTFPDSEMALLVEDLDEFDRIGYEYANDGGHLEVTASPDGTTFAGTDTGNDIGFVFTRERLWYPFECHGDYYCEVANSGAVIVGSGVTDATLSVYDEIGTEFFEMDIKSLEGVTISPNGQYFGYVEGPSQQVVRLCERTDSGTVSQTRVTGPARVDYDPESGGFRVANTRDGAFSKLLAPDGTILEEYDLDTSRGNINELLARVEEQPTKDVLADIRVAVEEKPNRLAPHVPSFMELLQEKKFPQEPETAVPLLFRTFAEETPDAFQSTVEELFTLLENPDVTYQSESAINILRELLNNDIAQDRIAERLHGLIEQGNEKQRRRAINALRGLPAADLVEHEAILKLLFDLLDLNMPPDLMNPVTSALSVHEFQDESIDIATKIATANKTKTLVMLLRHGHNRRGGVIGSGLSIEVSVSTDESVTSGDEPEGRNVNLDNRELYHLNQNVSTLLTTIAAERPETIVPHLGRLLLDVNTEGESLEIVRRNAVDIVQKLVDQEPDGLEMAAKRNSDTIIKLLDHDETRVGTLGIQLGVHSGTEYVCQEIKQIANTSSHHLWDEANDALNRTAGDNNADADSGGEASDTVLESLTRIARLPVDPTTALSLPSPDDIETYRSTANKERSDIERRGEDAQRIHRSYIRALEKGAVSPRLSVLADIVFSTTPDEAVIAAFPSGLRIQARREEADISRTELAEQAACSEERLQAIESNQVDPQAHEIEQILSTLAGTEPGGAYPERQSLREAWIEYGTQLAKALGRFPKSSEIVQYPDVEDNPLLDEEDIGFNGPESVDLDGEIPKIPHWSVFDGWDELLAELAVENAYRTSGGPLRSTLIKEIQEISQTIDGQPSTSYIDEYSDYSYHYYKKEFGGIQEAHDAAGIR